MGRDDRSAINLKQGMYLSGSLENINPHPAPETSRCIIEKVQPAEFSPLSNTQENYLVVFPENTGASTAIFQ